MTRHLVLVLGDQLSDGLSALAGLDPAQDIVVMGELPAETTYVRHHRQKIALVLAAMRHFRDALRARGIRVDYQQLDDADPAADVTTLLARAVARHRPQALVATEPGEWRLADTFAALPAQLGLPVEVRDDDRFLCSRARFAAWARGRRRFLMEHFYRDMRRDTGLLMGMDGQPEGGQWNFDAANREPWDGRTPLPVRRRYAPDATTRAVCTLVDERFAAHMGSCAEFAWPVTRAQALQALDDFLDQGLAHFGRFQDALVEGAPFLFHSLLSPCINLGLLDVREVCAAAESRWRRGEAPLAAVEGFIRQLIGWREYVRGLYWLLGPDYSQRNTLEARRALPAFYWSGDTGMACVRAAVGSTIAHGYAHHIQRLMVTGNFALLAGLDVQEVCAWYLAVYVDAFEWVELPNTLGMALHADGGQLASKPYCASGKYIDRMGDHCRQCRYDVRDTTGADACPFNALYWDFIARHGARFAGNPRMAMPLRSWARMAPERQQAIRGKAAQLLARLDDL